MGRPRARSSRLTRLLQRVARELNAIGARWCVVGGVAVHARARGGLLDDLDIAVVARDDREAEAIVHELQERGFIAVTDVEHEDVHRLASVRLLLAEDEESPSVQLLFASSGVEAEVVAGATVTKVLGLQVPVASIGHLIALKVLSHAPGRPQDAEDLALLLRRASTDDLAVAEETLSLIAQRGFHRGRDLRGDYEAFLARAAAVGR